MSFDFARSLVEQFPHLVRGDQLRCSEIGFVEPSRDTAHRVHFKPVRKPGLVADQTGQPDLQDRRQGLGERRQEDSGVAMRSGEVDRPMQSHDGLAGTRRAGDAGRAVVVPLHNLPLSRMEKDDPFVPGVIEGLAQLLRVGHHPEATLRVRVCKRVRVLGRGKRRTLSPPFGRPGAQPGDLHGPDSRM